MAEKKKTPEKKPAGKKAAAAQAPAAEAAAETKAPARKAKSRKAAPAPGPHAHLRFLRVAPRKVRIVADEVRGMKVGDALAMLKYTPQSASPHLAKLLRSAVANAEQKGGRVDVDALFVKTLTVDQGPKMRRFMPRAMGRAYRIEKKTSHVYVELGTA
ncbi:MAG TPA: 50S ribosomal protein L22 [Anaeromyxobacter sp.]